MPSTKFLNDGMSSRMYHRTYERLALDMPTRNGSIGPAAPRRRISPPTVSGLLADPVAAIAPAHVEVEVVGMRRIRARTENRREVGARAPSDRGQEPLLAATLRSVALDRKSTRLNSSH